MERRRAASMRMGFGRGSIFLLAMCLSPLLVACGDDAEVTSKAGVVRTADAKGDMRADPPADGGAPGPDLKQVSVEVDETHLVIEFTGWEEVAQLPKAARAGAGASWSFQVWTPAGGDSDARKYLVSVVSSPNPSDDFTVLLCGRHDRCNDVFPDARVSVEAATVTVRIPRRSVPELVIPFEWRASSSFYGVPQGMGRWFDSVPDGDGSDAAMRRRYPAKR